MSSIIKVDTVQDQDGNNIINENANTITIGASGDTITIPSGATLANNGTATGFASIAWQSSIVTAATITVESGKGYWLDTSSNAITVTLPAAPSVGDQIILTDYARNWATNNITINPNSLNFQGNTTPQPVYDTNGESIDIVYSGATKGWIPNTDGAVVLETPQIYNMDVLVVAGGGAAVNGNAGGGGGGGMRTTTYSNLSGATTFTITVGDGGTGITSGAYAPNGSDSSISGSGFTTITSTGGGGAGNGGFGGDGQDGGSGGGDGYAATAPAGSGNTPATTPSQGANGGDGAGAVAPAYGAGGGGGGGASGVNGANGSGSAGGGGGNGTQSSITGSAVYYAGGGGGAADNSTAASGAGGLGGGGPGAKSEVVTYCDGTANTGGGGGGHYTSPGRGGSGGKGVVILSMPLAKFSGTTTGSPTEADDGTTKILTFTGSGSYTG